MRKESLRDDLVELRKHRPTRASRMWEVTMAVKLDDYRELLEGINPTLRASLTANFTEAARVMSPAALHNYLEGARAVSPRFLSAPHLRRLREPRRLQAFHRPARDPSARRLRRLRRHRGR